MEIRFRVFDASVSSKDNKTSYLQPLECYTEQRRDQVRGLRCRSRTYANEDNRGDFDKSHSVGQSVREFGVERTQ